MSQIEALKLLEQGLLAVKHCTFSPNPTDEDFDRVEIIKILLEEITEFLGD